MVLMLSVQELLMLLERQLLLELQTLLERQQWLPHSPLQLAWRSQPCQLLQLFWK
jgi:hypothetical protein